MPRSAPPSPVLGRGASATFWVAAFAVRGQWHPFTPNFCRGVKIRDPQRDAMAKGSAAAALVKVLGALGKRAFYVAERSQVCVVGHRDEFTALTLDQRGRIIETRSPLGRQTADRFEADRPGAIRGSNGQVLQFSYEDEGRTVKTFRSDGSGEEVQVDRDGELKRHTLVDGSSLRIARGEHGVTSITQRGGAQTLRAYDQSGALESITDSLGRTTRFTRAADEGPDRIEYADGMVESYTYDDGVIAQHVDGALHAEYQAMPDGQLTAARYIDGQSFSLMRDDNDKVVLAVCDDATVQCAYDEEGRLVSEDQNGRVVSYTYDSDGRLAALTLPDGQTSRYEYDLDGGASLLLLIGGAACSDSRMGRPRHPRRGRSPTA